MNKKLKLVTILGLFFISSCAVRPDTPTYYQPVYIAPGIGLGTIIAVVISWSRNKSILWAIVHGFLGWLYVIYAALVPKRD